MAASTAVPALPTAVALPWRRVLRQVAAITAAGAGLGLLVGGVGSRLAMRALFLTSNPAVRGMTSDDGFSIGQFSPTATLSLLVVGTFAGIFGAFGYAAVRPFLMGPRWLRYAGCAVAGGLVVGSMLVHTDGIDFTLLEPRWFAIALFVALPALFGALVGPAVDRVLREDSWFQRAPLWAALTPLVFMVFPPLLIAAGIPAVMIGLAAPRIQASARGSALVHHPAALWGVRAVWVAIAIAGAVALTGDVTKLL